MQYTTPMRLSLPITALEFDSRPPEYIEKEALTVVAFCMATGQDSVAELLVELSNLTNNHYARSIHLLAWRQWKLDTAAVLEDMGQTEEDVMRQRVKGHDFALAIINYMHRKYFLKEK